MSLKQYGVGVQSMHEISNTLFGCIVSNLELRCPKVFPWTSKKPF